MLSDTKNNRNHVCCADCHLAECCGTCQTLPKLVQYLRAGLGLTQESPLSELLALLVNIILRQECLTMGNSLANYTKVVSICGLYYKNILMIKSDAYTINVLLALALASVANCALSLSLCHQLRS